MSERKKEELVCIVHSKESSLAMLADLNFYCKKPLRHEQHFEFNSGTKLCGLDTQGNCYSLVTAIKDDSTWYENHYIIHDSQEKTLDKAFVYFALSGLSRWNHH